LHLVVSVLLLRDLRFAHARRHAITYLTACWVASPQTVAVSPSVLADDESRATPEGRQPASSVGHG
jgi:hypothetical protein